MDLNGTTTSRNCLCSPDSDSTEGFEIAARVHGMIRLLLSADGRGLCWCASPSFWEPLPLQQLATLLP